MDKFGRVAYTGNISSAKRLRVDYTFPMTNDGDYDFGNRRLCNVKRPTEKSDVVTKEIIDIELSNLSNVLKDFGSKLEHLSEKLERMGEKLEKICEMISRSVELSASAYTTTVVPIHSSTL